MHDSNNPLISFYIISYNQEKYIGDALVAALAQTYEPLEIVLSDDHSTDSTFTIAQNIAGAYDGPHRIRVYRNETNLGIAGNVNKLVERTSGQVIVIAGGDDISEPDRTQLSWNVLSLDPNLQCVSLSLRHIDSAGELLHYVEPPTESDPIVRTLEDFLDAQGFFFTGASRAFRRSVFDVFGPLSADAQTEDTTIFFRCLLLGPVAKLEHPGVRYRIHGANYSMFEQAARIDREKILSQYLDDATVARDIGEIDESTFLRTQETLSTLTKRMIARQRLQSARVKTPVAIREIVPDTTLPFRTRLSYLILSLKRDATGILRRAKIMGKFCKRRMPR